MSPIGVHLACIRGASHSPGARPAYDSVGTQYAVANLTDDNPHTPLCPATVVAGDLLLSIAQLENGSDTGPSASLTAGAVTEGWVVIGSGLGSLPDGRDFLIGAYKIADGDEDGAAMVGGWTVAGTQSVDFTHINVFRFTAANGFAATPVINSAYAAQSGTTHTGPTLAGVTNGLSVHIIAQNDDTTGLDAIAGATGGTWSAETQIGTILANDGAMQVQHADTGASGISGGTDTVADLGRLTLSLVLQPANV